MVNENFKDLMRFQINRCRQYYKESLGGIRLIPNPACRFVILCMKEIYSGILDKIEKNGYNVFARRAYVTKLEKISIIFKILMGKYKYEG